MPQRCFKVKGMPADGGRPTYMCARVFEFAAGGGRRPRRPFKRSARGNRSPGRRTPPVLSAGVFRGGRRVACPEPVEGLGC
jgi:hypothetical protein